MQIRKPFSHSGWRVLISYYFTLSIIDFNNTICPKWRLVCKIEKWIDSAKVFIFKSKSFNIIGSFLSFFSCSSNELNILSNWSFNNNFNNYFIIHEFYYCLTIPILCLCMFELNKIFIIFVEITAIFLYYWKPKFHSEILNVT